MEFEACHPRHMHIRDQQEVRCRRRDFRKLSPEGNAFAAKPIDRIKPDIASRTDPSSSTIEISIFATSTLPDPLEHYSLQSPSAIASLSQFTCSYRRCGYQLVGQRLYLRIACTRLRQ